MDKLSKNLIITMIVLAVILVGLQFARVVIISMEMF